MKYLLIILNCLYLSTLPAQVGINNPNPSQALDVGGKIKVGDDQITPVAGTIRYNRVSKTFEGYDGTEWSVFNPDPDDGGGNSPPSGTVVGAEVQVGGDQGSIARFYPMIGGDFFEEVPAGRTLYITTIIISADGRHVVDVNWIRQSGLNNVGRNLRLVHDSAVDGIKELHDPNGYLMVIPAGDRIQIVNQFSHVRVHFRGFLQ